MGFQLHRLDIDAVIAAEPEAIERILKLVKDMVSILILDNWNQVRPEGHQNSGSSLGRAPCLKTPALILECVQRGAQERKVDVYIEQWVWLIPEQVRFRVCDGEGADYLGAEGDYIDTWGEDREVRAAG